MSDADPSEMTVAAIEEYVEDVDDGDELAELRAKEEAGKGRVTAIEAIDDRMQAVREANAKDAAEDVPRTGTEAAEHAWDVDGYVQVRQPAGGKTRIIECTPTEKRDIEVGRLEYLGPYER